MRPRISREVREACHEALGIGSVALYFLILVAMTAPLIMVAFYPLNSAMTSICPMGDKVYWMIVAVFVVAQAVMLIVPGGSFLAAA